MALFGKKLSLDDILKGIDELPAEDKEKVHAKMQDLYKAEDEREIDKIEEEKADNTEVKDEKGEEVKEETEEIGKDVDETKADVEEEQPEEKAEEIHEEEQEAKHEESAAKDDAHEQRLNKIEADIAEIKQMLANNAREPKEVSDEKADRLSELAKKYE